VAEIEAADVLLANHFVGCGLPVTGEAEMSMHAVISPLARSTSPPHQ
jgi:hypothetical protein